MGIKGIYAEIGPGTRVALSKLAVEKLEQENRPLRIAVDISIWHFQNQAGKGGANPALRTLYYRLLRLLSLSIHPIFVFDGPNKPKFKRNKRVGGSGGATLPNFLAKQVINFFGFPCHNAPGEAEAECALLQREGIVDAVLSEDVDTLMFGCGLTFRNWSSENHNGAPTHVSMYEAEATRTGKSGLDREGMVLVAMMSGGDYITEGIPGCGPKTACDAARAGFGKELCRISKSDEAGLQAWKQRLLHEIQTNESKFFKMKRKSLIIPENFPDREVLGYYTNPIVSTPEKIARMKREMMWEGEVDISGLRNFLKDAFDWGNKSGATKYIRGLAPALLVSKLLARGNRRASGFGDVILTALNEMDLVRSITGKRAHFSTDGTVELRLNFVPNDIVGLDLEAESDESEEYGRGGLAINPDDDDMENVLPDEEASPRKRGPSTYDPTVIDKVWVPQTIAKLGIPLKVEDYEEALRNPMKPVRKAAKPRATAKKTIAKDMPRGALDKFFTTNKPGTSAAALKDLNSGLSDTSQSALPPAFLAPALEDSTQIEPPAQKQVSGGKAARRSAPTKAAPVSRTTRSRTTKKVELSTQGNPWSRPNSDPSAPLQSVPINRHASTAAPVDPKKSRFKAPQRISFSPEPESLSQSIVLEEITSKEKDSEDRNPNSKLQKTPTKKRDSTLHEFWGTPPSKKATKSTKEFSETPISSNADIRVPFSSQKVNRKLFSPAPTDSNSQERAARRSREPTSSPGLPDLDDVFSSPVKRGGSSFTESFSTNMDVDDGSDVPVIVRGKNSERDVITIDSSPPPSPTPLRKKGKSILANTPSSGDEQWPVSPTRTKTKSGSNMSASPTLPRPLGNSAKMKGIDRGERKRYLQLRSSLEGTWKEVEEWDVAVGGKEGRIWGVGDVEVVDLSGD